MLSLGLGAVMHDVLGAPLRPPRSNQSADDRSNRIGLDMDRIESTKWRKRSARARRVRVRPSPRPPLPLPPPMRSALAARRARPALLRADRPTRAWMGEIAMRANLGTMNHVSLLALSRMCWGMWPTAGEMVQGELTRRGPAVKEEPDEQKAPDEAEDTRPLSFERFAHANRTRCVDG